MPRDVRGLGNEYLRLVAAAVALGGLSVALMNQKVTQFTPVARLVALVLMVLGTVTFLFLTYRARTACAPAPAGGRRVGSDRLIALLGFGHERILFPVYGVGLILAVLTYNHMAGNALDLRGFDGATIVLGAIFILYHRIPRSWAVERDFALLIFLFVFLLLVAPIMAYRLLMGAGPEEGSRAFSSALIVRPLSGVLEFLGIEARASGATLEFRDIHGIWQSVYVAFSCSGMYSTLIFISAFLALILVEYRRYNLKVAVILVLGVTAAYLANMLRMVILVLLGYYNGMGSSDDPAFGTLMWGHAYLGEIIFISWVVVFWALLYRYLIGPEMAAQRGVAEKDGGRDRTVGNVAGGMAVDRPRRRGTGRAHHRARGSGPRSDGGERGTDDKDRGERGQPDRGAPAHDLGPVEDAERDEVEPRQDDVDPDHEVDGTGQ